ncbi:GNAT domain-containing protein [Sordaria brevicollis]|uniref:GNAT domain-containing protein n=1 Tax=Sordaria brevicollis TaxID=83679 RepID=A0AAE0PE10_SORBR|nr:GNAT domain-containing protein [Sordaria brevicollis]
MAETAPVRDSFITVRTTLPRFPFPPISERPWANTERLLLRPLSASDLQALHELRTQPEVMIWTSAGRPDIDINETKAKLDTFLTDEGNGKTFNFAICFKEEPDKLVGIGGCHNSASSFGWPELGYMFRKEAWGQGIATEFVKAWLGLWKALPRQVVTVKCDERTLRGAEDGIYEKWENDEVVEERLIAMTTEDNARSKNILKKCGFEHFLTWKDKESRPNEEEVWIDLPTFRYFPGRN